MPDSPEDGGGGLEAGVPGGGGLDAGVPGGGGLEAGVPGGGGLGVGVLGGGGLVAGVPGGGGLAAGVPGGGGLLVGFGQQQSAPTKAQRPAPGASETRAHEEPIAIPPVSRVWPAGHTPA